MQVTEKTTHTDTEKRTSINKDFIKDLVIKNAANNSVQTFIENWDTYQHPPFFPGYASQAYSNYFSDLFNRLKVALSQNNLETAEKIHASITPEFFTKEILVDLFETAAQSQNIYAKYYFQDLIQSNLTHEDFIRLFPYTNSNVDWHLAIIDHPNFINKDVCINYLYGAWLAEVTTSPNVDRPLINRYQLIQILRHPDFITLKEAQFSHFFTTTLKSNPYVLMNHLPLSKMLVHQLSIAYGLSLSTTTPDIKSKILSHLNLDKLPFNSAFKLIQKTIVNLNYPLFVQLITRYAKSFDAYTSSKIFLEVILKNQSECRDLFAQYLITSPLIDKLDKLRIDEIRSKAFLYDADIIAPKMVELSKKTIGEKLINR